MGTRDPAGAIEGRTSQRLDRVHGRERAGSCCCNVLWFGVWVTVNSGMVGRLHPFDPFPFPFLTMTVSLEAIFLALFVLASQNRLSRQADKRSHLDLQIDLLAEREMTAVLQLLQDIAGHLEVRTTITPEQLRDLMKKTDLRQLTNRMEELAEPVVRSSSMEPESKGNLTRRRHPDRSDKAPMTSEAWLSICNFRLRDHDAADLDGGACAPDMA